LFGCASPETAPVPNRETPTDASQATSFIQRGNTLQGDTQHIASGQIFPNLVAGFLRVSTRAYDPTGRDVSVGYKYTVMHTPIVATIYVFPAPPAILDGTSNDIAAATRAEFARQEQGVAALHPGSVLLREDPVSMHANEQSINGLHATYNFIDSFDGSFAGNAPVPRLLKSDLFVYCCVGSAWALQYRFTYPREVDAKPAINRFMHALQIDLTVPEVN
jgi:hypothetical protein